MEKSSITKFLDNLEDIIDVTNLMKKMITRGKKILIQNHSMLIYLIEGMKSTCDELISGLICDKDGRSSKDKIVSKTLQSVSNSPRQTKESGEQNLFEELSEEISFSKNEIISLGTKIDDIKKTTYKNIGMMENLTMISQTIDQNLLKIEVLNRQVLEFSPIKENSLYKNYVSKSIQTKCVTTENKSTSTVGTLQYFDSTYLRPKFVLSQYPKSQHFTDKLTVIAVKSKNEYLIAQDSNGFGMMEFDDVFSQTNGDYWDVIYANGSYFLYDFNNEIVMRVNQNKEVDLICFHEGVDFNGRVFRVDFDDPSWLLMNKKYKSIVCMNTSNKESFEIEKTIGADCDDFHCLPNEKVLMLTEDGFLILQKYHKIQKKSEILTYKKIPLFRNRNEVAITLSVCPKNKMAAITTRVKTVYSMSRLILYEIGPSTLDYRAEIDLYDRETKYFCAMSFYNYFGKNLILAGLTRQENSMLCTFLYDGENFKELVSKRMMTEAKNPRKLQLVENEIIGADDFGKLIRIRYDYLSK